MTRGRKPKPTALKILHGEKNKDRINRNELAPPRGAPKPPKFLGRPARAKWRETVKRLDLLGILTPVDADALALYCDQWVRRIEMADYFTKLTPFTVDNETGDLAPNPLHKELFANVLKLDGELRRWEVEFGLTPSSRSRISVADVRQPSQRKDRFLTVTT